jgi:hypothetical protein
MEDVLARWEWATARAKWQRTNAGHVYWFGMSWIDRLVKEKLATLKPPSFAPNLIFGFDDVRRVIQLVEAAIDTNKVSTQEAGQDSLRRAAADPSHNWVDRPVFAPMADSMWEAEMTFPLILRRALFIAICAHVEHVLRQWCELLHDEWSLASELRSFSRTPAREADVHRCMRYLRDAAGLAIGDFEQWPEWPKIDACRVARNLLAHDGGLVEDPEQRKRLAQLQHVEIDESGILMAEPVLHLLPGACEIVADNAKTFFDRLTEVCAGDPRTKTSRLDSDLVKP